MAVETYFAQDNFSTRRTTGHNMLDPESLITGAELAQGFTYSNSHRVYPGQHTYDAIVAGDVPVSAVPIVAPRALNVPAFAIAKSEIVAQAAKLANVPLVRSRIVNLDVNEIAEEWLAWARQSSNVYSRREHRSA